jgi:hypothetical protein
MSDNTEKRELAAEAIAMRDGKDGAFAKAVMECRKRLFHEMINAEVGSSRACELHSMLKVLPAIVDELTIMINNYAASQNRSRK